MERGTVERHEIFLSGLRVSVLSSCAKTSRYLRRHWSAARLPMVRPDASCEIVVVADGSPRIEVDGQLVWSGGPVEDLAAGFEQWLYRAALMQHKRKFDVFHAAAVVSKGVAVVFSGPSGAGKSSLALAAVRRGWKYFSDEFVVTDGERIWGWPRAIRFDPPRNKAGCPDYLEELALDEDGAESPADPGPPYYPVGVGALQRSPCAAKVVRFVYVERGARTEVAPVSPHLGLKYWTEAAYYGPTVSLGTLVGRERCWRASWRHPDELVDVFERT